MNPDRELYDAWLARAADDLRLARAALAQDPPIGWAAVHHAHQAAEKALKGAMAAAGEPPVRTHDLLLLGAAAGPAPWLEPLHEDIERLNPYAVEPRYPEALAEYPLQEANRAIEAAERVVNGVKEAHAQG